MVYRVASLIKLDITSQPLNIKHMHGIRNIWNERGRHEMDAINLVLGLKGGFGTVGRVCSLSVLPRLWLAG